MKECLLYEKDDAVAILTINDAPYNRMSLDFMDLLEEHVDKIANDNSNIQIVISGNINEIKKFTGSAEQSDDITCGVIRVL